MAEELACVGLYAELGKGWVAIYAREDETANSEPTKGEPAKSLAVTITASHGCLVVRHPPGPHQPIHEAEGHLFIVDPKSCVGISREALDLMKQNKASSAFPVLRVEMGHDGGDIEMRLRYGGDYVLRPQWFYHSGIFEDLEACCTIIENSVSLSAEAAALEMVMSAGVGSAPRLIQEESRGAILQKYECRELDTSEAAKRSWS